MESTSIRRWLDTSHEMRELEVAMLVRMGMRGETMLLLDTCGERASLAVARDGRIEVERILMERTASGALLGAIKEMLREMEVGVADLCGIGVVNGPGSFTGLRVGLAMAKGLCEATGVKLAAVSRLAVLADASGIEEGIAILWAGREQVYVRESGGAERLMGAGELAAKYRACEIAFAEEALLPWLGDGSRAHHVEMRAGLSLGLVQQCLAEGGSDGARVDANYVRNEDTIYARQLTKA